MTKMQFAPWEWTRLADRYNNIIMIILRHLWPAESGGTRVGLFHFIMSACHCAGRCHAALGETGGCVAMLMGVVEIERRAGRDARVRAFSDLIQRNTRPTALLSGPT